MSTLKAGKLQHPDAANSSIEFDSSGNITKFVGPSGGADGNVLTKSGTAPAWTSAGAVGGLVLIDSESVSAVSSVSIDSIFTSAYRDYRIIIAGTGSADEGLRFQMRAGGSTDTGSNYIIRGIFMQTSTSVSGAYGATETRGILGSVQANGFSSIFDITQPNEAARTRVYLQAGDNGTGYPGYHTIHNVASAQNGIHIFTTGGTFTATINIYGYQK